MLGPGSLLREERRNRSMDIRQVAEATRLREHIILAIEREKWDELPPPVFVKGFIRSYALALGLDEQRVLDLYNQVRPVQTAEPKPLLKPEKHRRGLLIILLLVLGILAGGLLYLWQGNQVSDWSSTSSESPEPVVERSKIPPRITDGDESEEALKPPPEEVPYEPEEPPPETVIVPQEGEDLVSEQGPLPAGMDSYPDPVIPEQVPSEEVNALEIEVHEKTWVQISIDGGEPKSFIFQPGSRPGWKDGREFDLLIGNAGGINVIYEGKTLLRDIGKPGEVVRLRLPQDLESRDRGEQ